MNGFTAALSAHEMVAREPAADAPPRRLGAYAAARRHSRRVGLLKAAIPAGTGIAALLVVLWSFFNPFGRIPGLTLGPVSVSGTKVTMESPRLNGYRRDSQPYEITATAAFQDIRKPNVIELKDMRAKLSVDKSGALARMTAAGGTFDTQKEHLELGPDIHVTTDKGEEAILRSASIDFKGGTLNTSDPVRISSPSGTIDAEGMQLSDNGHVIAFTGRVRATFNQGSERAAPAAAGRAEVTGGPKL